VEILLVTSYFPPEGGSGSRLAGELSGFLAASGHRVRVVCPMPNYYVSPGPPTRSALTPASDPASESVSLVRSGFPTPRLLPHRVARGFEHLVRPFALFPAGCRLPAPDLVYGFSLPPAGVATAVALARWFRRPAASGSPGSPGSSGSLSSFSRGPRLVLHVEDLFPDNAVDTGLIPRGPVASALSAGMGTLLRCADRVIVHAPGLVPRLSARGIAAEAVPNWVDCNRFTVEPAGGRARWFPDCQGKCVAMFAGILGLAQGMDDLLGLAEATRGRDDLVLAVVGEGPRKGPFADEVRRRRLDHVRLMPLVPAEDYPALVAASDVFLVLLPGRVKYPVIPSRIGDGLAAGRPILAALPDGDAVEVVRASGGGVVVPPGRPEQLARELALLAGDAGLRSRLGKAGRAYALANLNLPVVLGRLERAIHACVGAQSDPPIHR